MCGIVGYVGPQPVVDVLVPGLSHLEYRGYDSAGTTVVGHDGELHVDASTDRQGVVGMLRRLAREVVSATPGASGAERVQSGQPGEMT